MLHHIVLARWYLLTYDGFHFVDMKVEYLNNPQISVQHLDFVGSYCATY